MNDNINHPKHYEDAGYLVQPIDVCQELPFCLGNAVKYLCRAGNKEGCPELEDLKKARWYLDRHVSIPDQGSIRVKLSKRAACAASFLSEANTILDGLFGRKGSLWSDDVVIDIAGIRYCREEVEVRIKELEAEECQSN